MLLLAAIASSAYAQQSIGTVAMQDATIAGNLEVADGRAILIGNSAVTARDRTASIALKRGGEVQVCSTSSLHLTAGKGTPGAPAGEQSIQPLMLALDRGAIEVRTSASTRDVVMTPDLRFALRTDGTLDLRLRVTRNGDTCVENRGDKAPTLGVTAQFGDESYELRPNQHVLFEHGSLREVVDHESSACGCPPQPGVSLADAVLNGGKTTAEAQHPFPSAISQGLAPAAEIPQAPPGAVHAEVAATLSYGANAAPNSLDTPASAAPALASASMPPPAPPPSAGLGHKIGRFFKRLFGGA